MAAGAVAVLKWPITWLAMQLAQSARGACQCPCCIGNAPRIKSVGVGLNERDGAVNEQMQLALCFTDGHAGCLFPVHPISAAAGRAAAVAVAGRQLIRAGHQCGQPRCQCGDMYVVARLSGLHEAVQLLPAGALLDGCLGEGGLVAGGMAVGGGRRVA